MRDRRGRDRGVVAALTMLATIATIATGARSRAQSPTTSLRPTAKLSWVRMPGAETCVDGDALRSRVSMRLGRDAFATPATLAIEGVVEHEGKKWVARLWVRAIDGAPIGTREIDSEAVGCDSLGDAAALAIALAIDPERALSASASVSASVSASASAPASASVSAPPASASASPPREPRVPALTVSAALAAGLAPKTAAGVTLSFDPDVSSRVRPVIGAALFPSRRTDEGTLGVGVSYGAIGACLRVAGARPLSLDGCALVLAGATHASVYDLAPVDPGDRLWLGASAGARFHVELASPLALDVGAEAIFPWIRRRFDAIDGGQRATLFTQPFVALVSTVGLAVRFDGAR